MRVYLKSKTTKVNDMEITNIKSVMIDKDTDLQQVLNEMFSDILEDGNEFEFGVGSSSDDDPVDTHFILTHYLMLIALANMSKKDREVFINRAHLIIQNRMIDFIEGDEEREDAKNILDEVASILKDMVSNSGIRRGIFTTDEIN